jgi:Lrp/AsnC family transcriptional regulator for asnA, asnC and gidA
MVHGFKNRDRIGISHSNIRFNMCFSVSLKSIPFQFKFFCVMDELDKFILRALQQDGRVPFSELGRRAGVSATTIRTRYQHLVKQGIVRTVGIFDPHALDFRAPAMIGISVEAGTINQVAAAVAELREISYLVLTLGSFDLIAEVLCRDLPHLTDFITQHLQMIPGVRSTETLLIGRSFKLSYRWAPALVLETPPEND